jgi:hypothetical protein
MSSSTTSPTPPRPTSGPVRGAPSGGACPHRRGPPGVPSLVAARLAALVSPPPRVPPALPPLQDPSGLAARRLGRPDGARPHRHRRAGAHPPPPGGAEPPAAWPPRPLQAWLAWRRHTRPAGEPIGLGGAGAWAPPKGAENPLQGLMRQCEERMMILRATGFPAAAGAPSHLQLWQRGEWEERMWVETVLSRLPLVGHFKTVMPRGGPIFRRGLRSPWRLSMGSSSGMADGPRRRALCLSP